MKKIEAIIRPHLLDAVRNALQEVNVAGMTISEVQGYGRQGGHTETYRGAEYKIDFVPKLKVEIVTGTENKDKVVAAIIKAVQTGQIGDGKIFVSEIKSAIRIRTGETDGAAL